MSCRSVYSQQRVPSLTTIQESEVHNEPCGDAQLADYKSSGDEGSPSEDAPLYNSGSSFPPPTHTEFLSTSSDGGDAYAERLRQIPGFETYQYDSESTGSLHDTNPTRDGTLSDLKVQVNQIKASAVVSNAQYSTAELIAARPRLKELGRMRKTIVDVQKKIDESNRKIARARREFLNELDEVSKRIEAHSNETSLSVQMGLVSLRGRSSDLKREEDDLEKLTDRFTQTHWNLRQKELDIYSRYVIGALTEDSESSEEDRMKQQASLTKSSIKELPIRAQRTIQFSEHLQKPQRLEAGDIHVSLIYDATSSNRAPTRPPSLTVAATRKSKSDIVQLDMQQPASVLGKPLPPIHESIMKHFGTWLDYEIPRSGNFADTLKHLESVEPSTIVPDISNSGVRAQAMSTPTFQGLTAVRRRDFQLLFGYDISKLDVEMTYVAMSDKPARPSKFKGLIDINVPTVHTRQYIAMWGRDMAQNASLEAYRIYQFSSFDYQRLIKARIKDPLVKLVQDVRQLYVPLDDKPFSQQTFITVNTELDSAEGLDDREDQDSLENHATDTQPDTRTDSKKS